MFLGGCSFMDAIRERADRDDDDDEVEETEEDEEEEEESEETSDTSETEETSETTETTEITEETVVENTKPAVTVETFSDNFPKAYLPVIDECLYHISGNVAEDDMFTVTGIDEYVMYYTYGSDMEDPLGHFGYALVDLNEDTVPELLVLENDEYSEIFEQAIIECYTIKDNEAVCLFDGVARDRYYLADDLSVIEIGSGGAAYSIWCRFRLDENGDLQKDEAYFTDFSVFDDDGNADINSEVVWYESNDGNYSAYNGDCTFYCKMEDFNPEITPYVFEGDEIVPFGYAEHRDEVIIDDLKYDEAKAACEERGGHLVAIETEKEAAVVQKIMAYNYADEKMLFTGADDGLWPNGEKVGKFLFPEGKVIREGYLGATVSGMDGSLILVSMSSDPMGEEYYYSGFIGYICEFEPS